MAAGGQVGTTAWLHGPQGWLPSRAERDGLRVLHMTPNGMWLEIYDLLISGIFHVVFLYQG